jgi:hypothetical protein
MQTMSEEAVCHKIIFFKVVFSTCASSPEVGKYYAVCAEALAAIAPRVSH